MIGSRFLRLLPNDFKLIKNVDRAEGLDILDYPGLLIALSSTKAEVIVHLAAFTDVNSRIRNPIRRDLYFFYLSADVNEITN